MIDLKSNLLQIEERIWKACDRANRRREEVTLIAVSKTVEAEVVKQAVEEGHFIFGENKVQELVHKQETLSDNRIEWHLIGHLQTNKVKYIGKTVSMIHSVDSIKLAKEIQKIALKNERIPDILVQVNIAREGTKFGLLPEEVLDFVTEISAFPNLRVRGLMTVAPFVHDSEENRKHFRELHKIMVDLNEKNIDNINMNVLSMGMTGDFEVAIEEGATHIRVGTGIFGERNYQI